MKQIQSLQNPLIKNILKLQEKSRERKKQQLFIIEGKREVELAFKSDFEIESLLFISQKIEPISTSNRNNAIVKELVISYN